MSRIQLSRFLVITVSVCLASACQQRGTCFRVTAFNEGGNAELFVENFPDGAFTKNALGNYQLAFALPPRRMPIRPVNAAKLDSPDVGDTDIAASDRVDESATDIVANQAVTAEPVPEEVYIAQFVLIDLLWHPEPGTTYVESTQTNAGLTYCLVRGGETVRYEGAGFVYFRLGRDGNSMTGRIESATLYPSAASSDAIDVLGPCRVTADFAATQSGRRVADVQRRLGAPTRANRVVGQAYSAE